MFLGVAAGAGASEAVAPDELVAEAGTAAGPVAEAEDAVAAHGEVGRSVVVAVEDEAALFGERSVDGNEPALHLVEVSLEAARPGVTVGKCPAFEVGGGLMFALGERKVPARSEGGSM